MHRIQDIKVAEAPIQIQIRVIRKWKHYTPNKELCYLFVDVHGDAIEATADLNNEAYFDSKMKLQDCYTISNYIAIPTRKYMAVVPHNASIRLGNKVLFQSISSTTIPTYYYNFATYEQLESRKPSPKPLTDYIGRIEKISPAMERAGKKKKQQSKTKQKLQLESTPATIAVINPEIPNLNTYIIRFKQINTSTSTTPADIILTIHDIFNKYNEDNTKTQFTCQASITEIIPNRKWYYVTCPSCQKKLYLEKGQPPKFVLEDDGIIPDPNFMYCVNTIIVDETKHARAVSFNEAMTELLDTSCKDMIINRGNTDPEIIPTEIYNIRGKNAILHVSVKKDGNMTVNRAKKNTFIPTTSDTKAIPFKKTQEQPTAAEVPAKRTKQ